jgi:hypothetical protein
MVFCGVLFYGVLVIVGVATFYLDRTMHMSRRSTVAMG